MAKPPANLSFTTRLARGMIGRPIAYSRDLSGVQKIAAAMARFGIDTDTMAGLLGVDAKSFRSVGPASAPEPQERLSNMLAVIDRVSEWAGGDAEALAWYRTVTLPAFGMTAAEAVRRDHGDAVLAYLDSIAAGGFA